MMGGVLGFFEPDLLGHLRCGDVEDDREDEDEHETKDDHLDPW